MDVYAARPRFHGQLDEQDQRSNDVEKCRGTPVAYVRPHNDPTLLTSQLSLKTDRLTCYLATKKEKEYYSVTCAGFLHILPYNPHFSNCLEGNC